MIGQTVDDSVATQIDQPVCVNVTSNDANETTVISISGAIYGTTHLNYPSFFLSSVCS